MMKCSAAYLFFFQKNMLAMERVWSLKFLMYMGKKKNLDETILEKGIRNPIPRMKPPKGKVSQVFFAHCDFPLQHCSLFTVCKCPWGVLNITLSRHRNLLILIRQGNRLLQLLLQTKKRLPLQSFELPPLPYK